LSIRSLLLAFLFAGAVGCQSVKDNKGADPVSSPAIEIEPSDNQLADGNSGESSANTDEPLDDESPDESQPAHDSPFPLFSPVESANIPDGSSITYDHSGPIPFEDQDAGFRALGPIRYLYHTGQVDEAVEGYRELAADQFIPAMYRVLGLFEAARIEVMRGNDREAAELFYEAANLAFEVPYRSYYRLFGARYFAEGAAYYYERAGSEAGVSVAAHLVDAITNDGSGKFLLYSTDGTAGHPQSGAQFAAEFDGWQRCCLDIFRSDGTSISFKYWDGTTEATLNLFRLRENISTELFIRNRHQAQSSADNGTAVGQLNLGTVEAGVVDGFSEGTIGYWSVKRPSGPGVLFGNFGIENGEWRLSGGFAYPEELGPAHLDRVLSVLNAVDWIYRSAEN